ncbi:MAG: hypothetical protein N4A46_13495 [Schleiferiaceae bacterium]|nr:hypothetical protein [Schleiferiaceae bacterium]
MKKLFAVLLMIPMAIVAQDFTPEQLLTNARNGALLFRLRTNAKKIEALKLKGRHEEAVKLEKQTQEEHNAWKNAFKEAYSFGKVYFFYDQDARKIANGTMNGVFTADGLSVEEKMDFIVAGLTETENYSIDGMEILAPNMKEVPKGMPSFISAYGFLRLSRKSPLKMVETLNDSMYRYLHKVEK